MAKAINVKHANQFFSTINHNTAFIKSTERIFCAIMLAYPEFEEIFELHTVASRPQLVHNCLTDGFSRYGLSHRCMKSLV